MDGPGRRAGSAPLRELTVPDLAEATARLRAPGADPLAALIASKHARAAALTAAAATLADELRVLECFAQIKLDWRALPCRQKMRLVLDHGVSFSPAELAALLGEKINTVYGNLLRMRIRGETKRERHGKWTSTRRKDVIGG